jgi:hypothetical protein
MTRTTSTPGHFLRLDCNNDARFNLSLGEALTLHRQTTKDFIKFGDSQSIFIGNYGTATGSQAMIDWGGSRTVGGESASRIEFIKPDISALFGAAPGTFYVNYQIYYASYFDPIFNPLIPDQDLTAGIMIAQENLAGLSGYSGKVTLDTDGLALGTHTLDVYDACRGGSIEVYGDEFDHLAFKVDPNQNYDLTIGDYNLTDSPNVYIKRGTDSGGNLFIGTSTNLAFNFEYNAVNQKYSLKLGGTNSNNTGFYIYGDDGTTKFSSEYSQFDGRHKIGVGGTGCGNNQFGVYNDSGIMVFNVDPAMNAIYITENQLWLQPNTNTTTDLLIIADGNDNLTSRITFYKNRNNGIVQDNDFIGDITFFANDGVANDRAAAQWLYKINGTPGAGVVPCDVQLWLNDGVALTQLLNISKIEDNKIEITGRAGQANYIHMFNTNGDILVGTQADGVGLFGTVSNTATTLMSNSVSRWQITSSGHLIPFQTGVYNIGVDSTNQVNDIYLSGRIEFSNNNWIYDNTGLLTASGNFYVTGDLTVNDDLIVNDAATITGFIKVGGNITGGANYGSFQGSHDMSTGSATGFVYEVVATGVGGANNITGTQYSIGGVGSGNEAIALDIRVGTTNFTEAIAVNILSNSNNQATGQINTALQCIANNSTANWGNRAIDTGGGSVYIYSGGWTNPTYLATSSSGDLYVKNNAEIGNYGYIGKLRVNNAGDGEVTAQIKWLNEPQGVNFTEWLDSSDNVLASIDKNGAFVFNENSLDADCRIEGNGDANLFYTDAGNDRIGIGTNTPAYKLDVGGSIGAIGDTFALVLGGGSDMTVYYNGTSGNISTADVAASDLKISCGTAKTVELQTVVWDDLRIIPGSFDRPGISDPSIVSYQPSGAGTTTYLYEFKKNDIASFACQLPHSYKQGEDIKVHIHWTPGANGVAENGNTVGWKIDYSWANINGTFSAMSTADLSDACDGTNHKHQMTPDVTITGTSKNISSMLICNIKRTDTGADDTWAGTASGSLPMLLEIDFHFPIDTIGSRQVGAK